MIRFLLSGSYSVEENWRKTKTGGRETSKSCLFSFFPSASRFPHTKPPDAFLVWTCFPGTASLVWIFIPWLLTMSAHVCSCACVHTHTHICTPRAWFSFWSFLGSIKISCCSPITRKSDQGTPGYIIWIKDLLSVGKTRKVHGIWSRDGDGAIWMYENYSQAA